jgi:hypothetical protein
VVQAVVHHHHHMNHQVIHLVAVLDTVEVPMLLSLLPILTKMVLLMEVNSATSPVSLCFDN